MLAKEVCTELHRKQIKNKKQKLWKFRQSRITEFTICAQLESLQFKVLLFNISLLPVVKETKPLKKRYAFQRSRNGSICEFILFYYVKWSLTCSYNLIGQKRCIFTHFFSTTVFWVNYYVRARVNNLLFDSLHIIKILQVYSWNSQVSITKESSTSIQQVPDVTSCRLGHIRWSGVANSSVMSNNHSRASQKLLDSKLFYGQWALQSPRYSHYLSQRLVFTNLAILLHAPPVNSFNDLLCSYKLYY